MTAAENRPISARSASAAKIGCVPAAAFGLALEGLQAVDRADEQHRHEELVAPVGALRGYAGTAHPPIDLALVERLPWRSAYAAKLICPASHFCSKAVGLVYSLTH